MQKKAKATLTGGGLVTPEEVIFAFDQFHHERGHA